MSATAVVDNAGSYTHEELLGRTGYAMQQLRRRGVDADKTVLLIAPNRREPVAVYLAALRLGARVVLMDRRSGKADVLAAAEATGPDVVVADPDIAETTSPGELPLLTLAEATAGILEAVEVAMPDTDRPAIILFTSGTSSRPKAVQHSMRSLLAGVGNMAHTLTFSPGDAPFLVSPLASITGVAQLHLALEYGGRLLLEDSFSPAESLRRLIDNGATVFGGAPFVLQELLAEAARRNCERLPLRAVAIGGAAIPRQLLEQAWSRYGIVPSRVYGSSECPIAFASAPGDDWNMRLQDEGVAMPGTHARIDPANGELQVRGENLFSGYLDPQHNDEAFTRDGWFRTGDQASLKTGRLVITGRIKEVVARKGLKISLGEVDELMRGMPGTLAAASYGMPDENTGERLALAVHADGSCEIGLGEVTDWLLSVGLAKWKLPEQIVVWNEPFPYTASGKVIRRELAARGSGRPTYYAKRLQVNT